MRIQRNFLAVSTLAVLLSGVCGIAVAATQNNAPVAFAADSLQNDEATKTVTARGNVELEQAGRILKADEVIYSVATDTVKARGNVVLLEPNGDVHFADELELTDEMRDGTVNHLRTTMKDGSRFWAEEGIRKQSDKQPKSTTMKKAAYTPCEACKNDPEADPIWQIKAGEVTHKEDEQRIVYRNATFDLWGVPVMYMPYFSHSDGTVKQKSGFLTPSAGFKSDLGLMLSNSYYMALAPHHDATIGLTAMTEQAPLVFGEYRRRFNNASLEVSGGLTYSDRTERDAGEDVAKGEEIRGHLFADGLWDINRKWRAGLEIEAASDDQYMRQYDFSSENVLENQLYVERFSGRNYGVGRLLAFQDVRIQAIQADQPNILPEIQMGFLGDAGQTLGGRWSLDFSTLALQRESDGQDLTRAIVQTGWQRRLVSDTGLLTTVDLKLRGDAYHVSDRDAAPEGSNRSGAGSETRAFAQTHIVTSYPVVKNMEKAQAVIEPIAALTVAPNINSESSNFPNEDSLDAQLDASNLFEPDRFPGLDRIEDQSRATYGIRTGLHGHEGSKAEVFVGQSYRFNDTDNPFPEGSGLESQKSDLVGQISASYKTRFNLDYRFQLDNNTHASRRHEVSSSANLGKVQVGAQYLYAKALEGTDLSEDREQVSASVSYSINDEWAVNTSVLQDLGDDPGLRKAGFGVDYFGQCFNISGVVVRNLTRGSSGDSNTEATIRIGLKNLGEFTTSGINLDGLGGQDDDDENDDDTDFREPID
jgi:LPS-assembly protein